LDKDRGGTKPLNPSSGDRTQSDEHERLGDSGPSNESVNLKSAGTTILKIETLKELAKHPFKINITEEEIEGRAMLLRFSKYYYYSGSGHH
jgi:hypothetical protein